jgi:hypothetical protein
VVTNVVSRPTPYGYDKPQKVTKKKERARTGSGQARPAGVEPDNQNIVGHYGGPHLPTARACIGGVAPVATVKPKFLGRNSAPPTDTRQTWPGPAQPGPARRSPIQPDPPRGAVLGQEGGPCSLCCEPWPGPLAPQANTYTPMSSVFASSAIALPLPQRGSAIADPRPPALRGLVLDQEGGGLPRCRHWCRCWC